VLGQLRLRARGIVSELRAAAGWPDEVVVEGAVTPSMDSNVITRPSAEASFRVALKWSGGRC
jgi:hypothetical protein